MSLLLKVLKRTNAANGWRYPLLLYLRNWGSAASELEKEWLEDPLFKNLEVAKNGEVHKVDDVIWNTAGGVKAANLMLDDIENTFLK